MIRKILVLLTFILFLNACFDKKEDVINIGIISGVSGKYSTLGTHVRDGMILAFEEIDYTVNDKKIKLFTKDDAQDEQTNIEAITNLLKNDVKIILGNATSSMTKLSLEVVSSTDALLFSPTASSDEFTSIDDNLIRLQGGHSDVTFNIIKEMLLKNKMDKILFIGDNTNKSYVDNYKTLLQDYLIKNKLPPYVMNIDSSTKYELILKNVLESETNLIMIAANSIDSSNIIQYLKLNKVETPFLIFGWAKTNSFIKNIGKNTKDVYCYSSFKGNMNSTKYKNFENKFFKLFNKKPNSFSAQGYDVASIVIDSLKKNDSAHIKKHILKTRTFEGLNGKIKINKFGDKIDIYNFFKIENNIFVKTDLN